MCPLPGCLVSLKLSSDLRKHLVEFHRAVDFDILSKMLDRLQDEKEITTEDLAIGFTQF